MNIESLIFLAGVGQICLVLGSLFIPKMLNWVEETNKMQPLLKQVFWTYAGYILITNLSFGLLSVLSPESLLEGTFLAQSVSLFITIYWFARILIQFFYFDRKATPKGIVYTLGEIGLVGSFLFFTVVYGYVLYLNLIS